MCVYRPSGRQIGAEPRASVLPQSNDRGEHSGVRDRTRAPFPGTFFFLKGSLLRVRRLGKEKPLQFVHCLREVYPPTPPHCNMVPLHRTASA